MGWSNSCGPLLRASSPALCWRYFPREKARKRESLLNLNLTFAAAQLAYAVAMALKRNSVNGEVEEGIASYEKALAEYREFEREQVSRL